MRIYVVTFGCYSDYHIEGIFSTLELANKYIADCLAEFDAGVEEYDLDEEAGKTTMTNYRCEIPGGKCWTFDVKDVPTKRTPDKSIKPIEGSHFFYADSYVSEEHARKLAIEEYQRRLRKKAEGLEDQKG